MVLTTGRLLVLDDDHQVSSTIREMAQAAGFSAKSCTSPGEFFAQIPEFNPTHIILDLAMPAIDGVEVMRRLANQQCSATIIIISGLGEKVLNSARTAANESGLRVAGVLTKPFRISALRTLLNTYTTAPADKSNKKVTTELSQDELQDVLDNMRLQGCYQHKINCHIISF